MSETVRRGDDVVSRVAIGRSIHVQFESLLGQVLAACQQQYGDRLVPVAVFGSVGRGTPRLDSDLFGLVQSPPGPPGGAADLAR